jgi:hypothetical protein
MGSPILVWPNAMFHTFLHAHQSTSVILAIDPHQGKMVLLMAYIIILHHMRLSIVIHAMCLQAVTEMATPILRLVMPIRLLTLLVAGDLSSIGYFLMHFPQIV